MTLSAVNATPLAGPYLVIVRGVPGSGKSYLTYELARTLGEDRVVVLDPDAIDTTSSAFRELSQKLTVEGVDEKFHPYRFSREQAYSGIVASKFIIWNQPFIDFDGFQKTIDRLQTYAAEHDKVLPALVVEVEVDEASARQRVATRIEQGGHGPEADVFDRFFREYRSFAGKGYNTVGVDGTAPLAHSIATIIEVLKSTAAA